MVTMVATTTFAAKHQTSDTTPTIFFHGYSSSSKAEDSMAQSLIKSGHAKTDITAEVGADGKITLHDDRKKDKSAAPDIVEVNFDNNRDSNYEDQATWVFNVITTLQKDYKINKMNIVAHSMGNMAVMYYILHHGQDKKLPQMQKFFAIAGTYNGAMGWNEPDNYTVDAKTGQPSEENDRFKVLLPLRKTFPKQIEVMNVYGDTTGKGDDTMVTNKSCQTMRYLLNGRAKSYKEYKVTGDLARHEKLHENPEINKALNKFLFPAQKHHHKTVHHGLFG